MWQTLHLGAVADTSLSFEKVAVSKSLKLGSDEQLSPGTRQARKKAADRLHGLHRAGNRSS